MIRNLFPLVGALAVIAGLVSNHHAQDDDKRKREEVFGKSFEERVEDAVDRGCDWLKKQQGIERGEDPAVFGQFPPNPPTYGQGTPHRYRVARTAFPIQALCKSGVFHDDPAIQKAMDYLRKNYKEAGVLNYVQGELTSTTYEDATLLNAVEAYYISAIEAKERGLDHPSKRFVRDENGKKVPVKRWGTEEKGAKKAKERKPQPIVLTAQDKRMCELAVKSLLARYRRAYGAGGWRYAPPNIGESKPAIDISATQYAMLGLKCATRLGIKYDRSILMDVYHYFRTQQDKDGPAVVRPEAEPEGDGKADKPEQPKKNPDRATSSREYKPKKNDKARGWGYSRQDPHSQLDTVTYGSMTAAGIVGLVLVRDELETDPRIIQRWKAVEANCDQMISDGLAWLVMNWTMQENPKAGMHRYYYYLYTIERLGMLGGVDFIGKRDWYHEGAEVLLKQQTKGGESHGMWDVQHEVDPSDIYNTCYALLFLKRATATIDRPRPVFTGDND